VDTRSSIEPLVTQMRGASDAGLFFPALMVALTLPDILSALSSDNGEASRSKYQAWASKYLEMDATQLYGFRCSLLHQGSSRPHGNHGRLVFVDPTDLGLQVHGGDYGGAELHTWISVPMFVDDICRAVEQWLADDGSSTLVVQNLDKFVRLRPEGYGFVEGHPVFA
jgi:hypothetical protein